MKKLLTPILALAMLLAITKGAQATPITYNVNLTLGNGSATGSITTNGSVGILGTGHILDWDLLLNDGITTFALDGTTNSARSVVGSGLVATLTELTFDFSSSGYLLFQNPSTGSGINYLVFRGADQLPASSITVKTNSEAAKDTVTMTGVQTIATVAPTSVPDAGSTLPLLGFGLMAIAAGRRTLAARR